MAEIRTFCAVHPAEGLASKLAALPYDVYSRDEAREQVKKAPESFLAIDRPETQFPKDQDMYAPEVYQKAHDMLEEWIKRGSFVQDQQKCYYLYELTMDGRSQTGLVACASIDDYLNGVIKKHENTRAEKEQDRIRHVDTCNAQTGPIFLAYRKDQTIAEVTAKIKQQKPMFAFVSEDGIGHKGWRVDAKEDIAIIADTFANIDKIYIADGHHRAASAVKVGQLRRKQHPDYDGSCFHRTDQLLTEMEQETVRFMRNHYLEQDLYFMQYLMMRREQCEILRMIYRQICKLTLIPTQAKPLSDYLQTISDQYHETNDAVALLEELDALHRFYQEQPLPETREQFENRAILYAILSDLRSLLQIKQQFSVSLPKKGRGSSSFYRKQNFKTN